jgi:hypothetical protein
MATSVLSPSDLERLSAHGIAREEAERQLRLFAGPPPRTRLLRPCVRGDGLEVFGANRQAELVRKGAAAAHDGRLLKFVPASGAATRMFAELARALEGDGAALDELRAGIDRFPFAAALDEALRRSGSGLDESAATGDLERIARHLLEPIGLGYAALPKALLEFHRYADGARTAFEEHLVEAADYVRDADRLCRLHFTISAEHREPFAALLAALREPLAARTACRFEVSFSEQSPATDTLAADFESRPFRLDDGGLLLRPGGHGALIHNLSELAAGDRAADVVLIKNIDNVVPDRTKPLIALWKSVLVGALVELEERSFELLESLEGPTPSPAVLAEGLDFVHGALGLDAGGAIRGAAAAEQRDYLIARLDRPLRVCGMVENEGEPGGGPFWVRDGDGASVQIVEQSQIDGGDEGQRRILAAGTHFNPVDLVCALRDRHGRPYDLERFIDHQAVFISRKSKGGRELKALERPGLWNGAMAHWNTLFVEVPPATFAPVKTVFDLLRPAHQVEGA